MRRAPLFPLATALVIGGAVSAGGAVAAEGGFAAWSNYCQAGWQPYQRCVVAAPTARRRMGFYASIRPGYVGDVSEAPGTSDVVSFTNSGCALTSTPIAVYWVERGGPLTDPVAAVTELGSIASTKVGKTSSLTATIPGPPDDRPGWTGGIEIAFSWPETRRCTNFAPAYTGMWTIGVGPPPEPDGRITFAPNGPSTEIDTFASSGLSSAANGAKSNEEYDVVVPLDSVSSRLQEDSANGRVYATATIVVYKRHSTVPAVTIKLTHVTIDSFVVTGSSDGSDPARPLVALAVSGTAAAITH